MIRLGDNLASGSRPHPWGRSLLLVEREGADLKASPIWRSRRGSNPPFASGGRNSGTAAGRPWLTSFTCPARICLVGTRFLGQPYGEEQQIGTVLREALADEAFDRLWL